MRAKSFSAARKGSLSKSNLIIIDCFARPWGTACKRTLFGSSWGIFLDSSDPRNLERRLFNYCSIVVNCRSLIPLGLRTIYRISLFCFTSALLSKKYFRRNFWFLVDGSSLHLQRWQQLNHILVANHLLARSSEMESSLRWMKFLPKPLPCKSWLGAIWFNLGGLTQRSSFLIHMFWKLFCLDCVEF